MTLTPPGETYPFGSFLVAADGQAITCLVCGTVSRDVRNVREKYCPKCLVFHEDRTFMMRLSEGYQAQFHTEEPQAAWVRAA